MSDKPLSGDLSTVPTGWTPQAWVARLHQVAGACESVNPARAQELRDAAALLDGRADADDPFAIDPFTFDLATTFPPDIPVIERF